MLQSALLRSPNLNRVVTDGRVVHIPRIKTAPAAQFVAELAQIPSDAGDADQLVLTPRKAADVVTLSRESVEDASVDELNAVATAMTRGIGRTLDVAFFSAAAATAVTPAGLRSYVLPGGAGGVTIDRILDGVGAIEAVGGTPDVAWLAPADVTALRKAKDSQNRYLLEPDEQLQEGGATRIAGVSLIPSAGLTAGTAIIADSRFVTVAIRRDIEVQASTDAAFTQDGIVLRITARIDWAPSDLNGLYVLTTP